VWRRSGLGSDGGAANLGRTGGDGMNLLVGGVFAAWSSPGSGQALRPSWWRRLSGLGSATVGRTGGDGVVGFFFF
jgi:hypothetical protein